MDSGIANQMKCLTFILRLMFIIPQFNVYGENYILKQHFCCPMDGVHSITAFNFVLVQISYVYTNQSVILLECSVVGMKHANASD